MAISLGCDDALARTATHVAPSMGPGTDPAQLQSAVWDWIVATVNSTQFMVGAAAGVICAEAGRFVWRWAFRILGGATQIANFVVHHRLIFVCTCAVAGYAVVRFAA